MDDANPNPPIHNCVGHHGFSHLGTSLRRAPCDRIDRRSETAENLPRQCVLGLETTGTNRLAARL